MLVLINVSSALLASTAVDGSSWWNETQISTEGKEFYLTFMHNYGKGDSDGVKDLVLTLYATSHYNTKVYVQGVHADGNTYNATFNVEANKMSFLVIPNDVAYVDNIGTALNKGLKVTSDNLITLYSSSTNGSSYDASLIYPVDAYFKEYVIQTYPEDEQSTEFAIVSTADNNFITIAIKETEISFWGDTSVTNKVDTITLNQGQVYQYKPNIRYVSLSGTTICSEEPIALFQGGQHAKVPAGNGNASHLYNNAPPTNAWGKDYIITRTENKIADVVSFVAAQDGTKILCDGQLKAIIDKGESFQENIDWSANPLGAQHYHTSKATGCYIFQTGDSKSPTMTDITPLECLIQRVILTNFDYRFTAENLFPIDNHYVNIVVPTEFVDAMMIDGILIPQGEFKSLPNPINNTYYSYTCKKLTQGSHVLENKKGGFVAHAYGVSSELFRIGYITYSYSAGRNILPPAWILIDGKRVNQKAICEGDPPITFTSVINYDYTNVRWEFHSLQGEIYDSVLTRTQRGDSIISRHYVDVEEDPTTSVHIDSVYMIVERTTPICNYTIIDTIKAAIIVNDTFAIVDKQNVCYGDTMVLHYKGTEVKIPADTLNTYRFGNKSYKLSLNNDISFLDSLKTNAACDTCKHCDSIINQVRIIRPTYDTLLYDTICVNKLPYQWLDKNGELIDVLDLSDKEKKELYLTKERTYASKIINDSVMMSTEYGCDSLVRIQLTVLPIYNLEEYAKAIADGIEMTLKEMYGE